MLTVVASCVSLWWLSCQRAFEGETRASVLFLLDELAVLGFCEPERRFAPTKIPTSTFRVYEGIFEALEQLVHSATSCTTFL
jgi:hypothetical protein